MWQGSAVFTEDTIMDREPKVKHESVSPIRTGGRPLGAKNKSTILKEIIENNVQKQFAEFVEEAANHLMEGVREKDSTCTKIFWDRVMPSQKAVDGATASVPLVTINISGLENVPEAIVVEDPDES